MFGDPLSSYIFGKLLDMFPGWVSRKFLPQQKVAKQIGVELNRSNPISVCLYQVNSYMEIYFEIANGSPIDINLDRLLIDVWIGRPIISDAVLERFDIPKKPIKDNIRLSVPLSNQKVEKVKHSLNSQSLINQIMLDVSGYFDSKNGRLHVAKRLERRDAPLNAGPP